MKKEKILQELAAMPGKVGFYYKNVVTGETLGYNQQESFLPASVVKLPLMMAILLFRSRGETDFDERITIRDDQKVPGCGAVQHIPGEVTLEMGALAKMMITISDNTATNALLRHYTVPKVREAFHELGMIGTQFNREYYDYESENKGIQNYFVPEELGILLEKMYRRTLINEEASIWLENVLRQQQINHKMGGYLPMDYPMAHKTGEEEDKTHDVGIVFAKQPFIVCYASNDIEIAVFEDFIRRTTKALADEADAADESCCKK